MKKVRMVGIGLLVCLVMGSLAMAHTPEGIPGGWEEHLIQKDECLTVLAVRVPGVSKANMIWAAEGIGWVNGIGQDRINLIYAWSPIYLPESVEALEKALKAKQRMIPEKRAPTRQELQTKVSQLEWILGDQGVAFEKLQKEKKEKEDSRAMLADEVDKLENANFWYSRLLLLAGLLLLVFGVLLGVAIKAEVKREKQLEEAEKDNEKLQRDLWQLRKDKDQKVKELQEFIPGNSIKIKAEKGGKKVEKDCKITEVHLTEGKLRRQLKCPYCGIKIWEKNMPGHWEVCKKGPFPKSRK